MPDTQNHSEGESQSQSESESQSQVEVGVEVESPVESPVEVETVETVPAVPDDVLLASVDLARDALLEITPASTVGAPAGHFVEGEHVLSLLFDCTMPGYPGWHWTVTISRIDDESAPTVLEAELMPGERALLSPDWVPWSERLAEYQASQEALHAADAGDAGDESDEDADDYDDEDADEFDDEDEDPDEDDDEDDDGSLDVHTLHAGDIDGVDIDDIDADLDEPADDEPADDSAALDAEVTESDKAER